MAELAPKLQYKIRLIMGDWFIFLYHGEAGVRSGPFTWAALQPLIIQAEEDGYEKEQ